MLYGKNVVFGITGSIAAYKACDVVSALKKLGANVDVIMTDAACEFVAPLTLETLSKNAVVRGMFDEKRIYDVAHVSLAKKADIFVVAPASADTIAKLAGGIADDMLCCTYLACKAKKLVCPAMNTAMYEDAATKKNIETLCSRGAEILEPATGVLACGDTGKGKLASPVEITDKIVEMLSPIRDFDSKRVLVTAGATEENIDGVRVITNHSSGKMGCAIAAAAAERGAIVTLVYGNMKTEPPASAFKTIKVSSTSDMFDTVIAETENSDVIVMAAAPADYRLKSEYKNKIKSDTLTLELEKNPDIAAAVGKIKGERRLVIFSAETEELYANARAKLKKKNADFAVANDVTKEGAGFYTDTNIASVIDAEGNVTDYPLMDKRALADIILDRIAALR